MAIKKESLASQISGTVLVPGDEGYEESLKRWSGVSQKNAGYVALVENAEDISKTIVWATKHNLDLAIRGGGHSSSGASSTEGGVVVDLSKMRNVRVDPENRIAYAQGGALWEDFDKATTAHGLVSVGGTINHTGLGGLITGGGFGYLTGQYGLAIDNLLEATVVVADGRIVKASEIENPDLFWGIRGGGSNLGVVSEFVIRLFPHQGNVFGGMAMFTPDKFPGIVAAFKNLWAKGLQDIYCTVAIAAIAPENQPLAVLVPFRDTPDEAVGRETFAEFLALDPVVDRLGIHPYAQQNAINNQLAVHGPRTYVTGFAYQTLSIPLLNYTLEKYSSYIANLGDNYVTSVILYEAYPTAKTCEIPPDGTAYANRGNWFNCAMMLRWKGAEHDIWVKEWIKDFVKGAHAIDAQVATASGQEVLEKTAYANIPLPDSTPGDAFRGNLPRLTELKKKWDPNGRFNKWHNISPN